MKQFLTICLAIITLMILTVNALAETPRWKEVAEQVAQLESKHGYYDKWKTKTKVELVRILSEAGEVSGSDVDKVLGKKTKDKKKGSLCDKIMKEYVGGPIDLVCLESIIYGLHGQDWTMEDKVWYNEMLKRNGLSFDSDACYTLPREGELSEKEIIERGRNFLNSVGATQVNQAKHVEATFEEIKEDLFDDDGTQLYVIGTRSWSLIFEPDPEKDPNYSTLCTVDLSPTGEILGYHVPEFTCIFVWGKLPDENACPQDMALDIGKKALAQAAGVDESQLSGVKIFFGEIHAKDESFAHCAFRQHVWAVLAEPNYYALLSPGGQVIYAGKHGSYVNGRWQAAE